MPPVSIVVLSYNRLADLRVNVPQLAEWCGEFGYELIVADNASTDGSQEYLAEAKSQFSVLQVVQNSENLGVGSGRNSGFRIANGRIILCLDDDSLPQREFLADLPALFEAYPEAGLICPLVIGKVDRVPDNYHGDEPAWVANFHGACHAFKREVVDCIGLQDEGCEFGGEEIDYSIRAHDAGFKTLYHPGYISEHNVVQQTGPERSRRTARWIYNYSRVLTKNFGPEKGAALAKNYTRVRWAALIRGRHFELAKALWPEHARGVQKGCEDVNLVSEGTLSFYSDPDLRPFFGNVPLPVYIANSLTGKCNEEAAEKHLVGVRPLKSSH
ncbi:glycosyltransferase [Kamptonema cortianum]|nr:glycosyltransferase [Kamptonema cortianum]